MKDLKRIVFLFVLVSALVQSISCQSNIEHYSGAITTVHSIESHSNRSYELHVTTPPGYTPDETYEALYYLDAWWLEDLVRGSYMLNYLSNAIQPIILVGIAIDGDEDEWNRQRNWDYTPTPYSIEKMKVSMDSGSIPLNVETTGGADEFLAFLESNLFPFIESIYQVKSKNRGLIGHSFGGLFGIYTLLNHPEVFENYILISPAIWWNRSEIFQESKMNSLFELESKKQLFIGVGDQESKLLVNAILDFNLQIEEMQLEHCDLQFKRYQNTDHQSLLPQAIFDGIDKFYKKSKKE